MDNKGTIYKIENLVNGKVYVGQTVRNYKRRMYEHRRKLRNGYHDNCFLQNAWNAYGEKSFKFSIIIECCVEEIDNLEVKYILFYRNKKLSYNLESGGNNQKKLHDTTKKKLSERTKNLRWLGGNHPNARKVICINTGNIYDSIVEASNDLGVSYGSLFNVLNGNNTSARTKNNMYYQFSYYEEGKKYCLKKIKNIKTPKKVICITTGDIFNSTREAAEAMNVQQSKISLCCNGKRNYTGKLSDGTKLRWEFCS